jgi:hypothetical protein
MISTEMPRCALTVHGGVEHAADVGARDGSPVHADVNGRRVNWSMTTSTQ